MSRADRMQRALGIVRRSAHQYAFDRAFQEGGEVALPQITVRPDDEQQSADDAYDPLAGATSEPSPGLARVGRSVADWAAAPGRIAQQKQPRAGGMWSDVDEATRQANAAGEANWGAGTALGMVGTPGGVGGLGSGIRAYHGSPHSFERFSTEHVGTGEGAQAYGHGLYFAEAEPTAQAYKKDLAGRVYQSVSGPVRFGEMFNALEDVGAAQGLHRDQAYQLARTVADKIERGVPLDDIEYPVKKFNDAYYAIVNHAQKQRYAPSPGHVYEVNINADPEHFLDWDKPLSEQHPTVQEKLSSFSPHMTGAQINESARLVPGKYRDDSVAAKNLRDLGIPGIRYLDQGSRGAGKGTYNYVVFDDKLIDIIKKYGLAGLIAGGAAHFTAPMDQVHDKGGKDTASQMARRHAHQTAFDQAFPRR